MRFTSPILSNDIAYFDRAAAQHAVDFFEQNLCHTKGRWAGKPFLLDMEWERYIIRSLYGWRRRSDGLRLYRRAYISVPRKTGKSELCAGIALYMLVADGEQTPEVYSVACDEYQAAIVFEDAKRMVVASSTLSAQVSLGASQLRCGQNNGKYRVLSREVGSKHGLNASCVIFDELHAQKSRLLWDTLCTSTMAREEPFIVAITTAGDDNETICGEQYEYACNIARGHVVDPSYFVFIQQADPEKDDWTKVETWIASNPAYNVIIKPEEIADAANKAVNNVGEQNAFKQLRLNMWVHQSKRWLDLSYWDKCKVPVGSLEGRKGYIGFDLATTTDIAAAVEVWAPLEKGGRWGLIPMFFIPADNIKSRSERDHVNYAAWVQRGFIRTTNGNVVDYEVIRAYANERKKQAPGIAGAATDPWNATQFATSLIADGWDVISVQQGWKSLSPASKEFERLLQSECLAHDGNPVMRWMADNCAVVRDPAGNIKPTKANPIKRIDGISAAISALFRFVMTPEEPPASPGIFVYDAGHYVDILKP
jgi:phage terminase large subunit-like protein